MRKSLLTLFISFTALTNLTLAQDCVNRNQGVHVDPTITQAMEIAENLRYASGSATANIAGQESLHPDDKRKARSASTPKYLNAVGRLLITHSDGKVGICTAQLTSYTPGEASRVLTSNAHCFDGNVESIRWETFTNGGKVISKRAFLKHAEDNTDTAVLVLRDKVPFNQVQPLLMDNEGYDAKGMIQAYATRGLVAAGYSSDQEKGGSGSKLTYDDSIRASKAEDVDYLFTIVDTVTFKGASGGALIAKHSEFGEYNLRPTANPHKQHFLVGTLIGNIVNKPSNEITSANGAVGGNKSIFSNYNNYNYNAADAVIRDWNERD